MIKDVVVHNGLLGIPTGTFVCMATRTLAGNGLRGNARYSPDIAGLKGNLSGLSGGVAITSNDNALLNHVLSEEPPYRQRRFFLFAD
jgi:hypothetical protein